MDSAHCTPHHCTVLCGRWVQGPSEASKLILAPASQLQQKHDSPCPLPAALALCRSYVGEDELIEVTPTKLRLRKRVLESGQRKTLRRRAATA